MMLTPSMSGRPRSSRITSGQWEVIMVMALPPVGEMMAS